LIDCQVHNALHFDRFGGKKAIIFDRRECSLLFKSPTFGLRKSSNDHIL